MIEDIINKINPYVFDKKCVIMDMDGTILDSMKMWHELDVVYLGSMGLEATPEFCEAVKTLTIYEASDYIVESYKLDKSGETVAREILDMSEDKYRNEIPLKGNAALLMKYFHDRGQKIVIATSNEEELTKTALSRNGVMEYVDYIITSTMVGISKEFPDIYIKAGELAGAGIDECVVFEDSLHAVRTVSKTDFTLIAVYDETEEENWEEIKELADCWVVL